METLYDRRGKPIAFIADGQYIYLYSGRPVGWIDDDSVYAYSGRYLGWVQNGWFYDRR
jgi:hypothetical protein